MNGGDVMFLHKNQNFYSSNFEEYVDNLYRGDWTYLPLIFCVFAENSPNLKLRASQVLNELLMSFSIGDVCKMDMQMRETTSIEWSIDWRNLNIQNFITEQMSVTEKRAVLIFSSFNPNGFIRQQAVELLASHKQTLPYIFLRLNDWVPNVRQSALIALSDEIKFATDEEILNSFPYVDKLRKSERCDYSSTIAILKNKIADNKEILAKGLTSQDIRTRRICLSLADFSPVNRTFLLSHITKEKDPFLRKMIFQLLIKSNIPIDKLSERFLQDKHPANRLMVLQYLCNHSPTLAFTHAEHMLLDKNSQIRIIARDIILHKNRNFDFHQFYFEALSTKTSIAIYGLGEVGDLGDCHTIERYLNDERISVIRATIISLMRLNSKGFVSCVTDMLDSEYAGIVKTAKMLLEKYRDYDFERIFEIQKNTAYENTKIKCASLLFLAPKWKSLIYTLILIDNGCEKLEVMCQVQIRKWISSYNRSYQSASQEEIERIKALITMKKSNLNLQIEKQLLFLLR